MTDEPPRLRVVIADDHPGILEQVSAILRPEFDIVATAHDGPLALDCIRRLDPDVALLDLYMPGMSGLDIISNLKASSSRTVAVIMTGHNDPELVKAVLAAGAMGFVTKFQLADDLPAALRDAVRGSVFVSRSRTL